MHNWQDYLRPSGEAHTVAGTLKLLPALRSPQLDTTRDILVYLPPSYAQGNRSYPVLYMHDGQNLFDKVTSFAGEWEVDETLEAWSLRGLEAIVVGIPNGGISRLDEYSPYRGRRGRGGQGDAYLRFLAETVKPIIDADFRTLPDRMSTGIAGSSMGGLISLYAFFRYSAVFGLAGVLSPSLWFGDGAIFRDVTAAPFLPGRIYLDVGAQEGRGMLSDAQRMDALLRRKGYRPDHELCYVEDPGGRHTESAWAHRFVHALPFLLDHPHVTVLPEHLRVRTKAVLTRPR